MSWSHSFDCRYMYASEKIKRSEVLKIKGTKVIQKGLIMDKIKGDGVRGM